MRQVLSLEGGNCVCVCVCVYPSFNPSHFFQDKDALIAGVPVKVLHSFMDGFQSLFMIEGEQSGAVGADPHHLLISQF